MTMSWVRHIFSRNKPTIKDEGLFPFVEFQSAANDLIVWSGSIDTPIHHIEWLTPNMYSPGTRVWIFCEKDSGLHRWTKNMRSTIEDQCVLFLKKRRFPSKLVPSLTFTYDSSENVEKNYEGSYYYRLRG